VPTGVLVVGGAAVVGGGVYMLNRRRRRRAGAPADTGPAPPDRFGGVTTDDLAYRASAALIEVDDAVRTSEQELSAARAHFGDDAVAEFSAALEQSRADMLAAFETRQRLDDDQPEDEPTKRSMYGDIISACRTADERLDAQAEAFDRPGGEGARVRHRPGQPSRLHHGPAAGGRDGVDGAAGALRPVRADAGVRQR
jgi:hypothetical protein